MLSQIPGTSPGSTPCCTCCCTAPRPHPQRCLRPGRSHGPAPGAPRSPGKTWPRLTPQAGEGTPRCSHPTTTLQLPPPKARSRTRGTSQAKPSTPPPRHAPCPGRGEDRGAQNHPLAPHPTPPGSRPGRVPPRGGHATALPPGTAARHHGGKPRHHHVSVGTSPPPVPQSHGAGSLPDPGVDSGWMRLMLALTVTQSPRHRAGERPAGTDPCSTSGTPCARSATSRPRTGAAFPSPVPGLGRAGSWQTGDHLPAARDGWGRVFWRHLLPRRPRQRGG